MQYYHGVVLLLLVRMGVSTPSPVSSCVPLNGIVQDGNGTTTTLNLAEIKASMNTEIFDFSNPVIPTLAACSSGLETPVAMRTLLAIDSSVWSVASAFQPSPWLNIFGDKRTSDKRRRCSGSTNDEEELFLLHYRVAEIYTVTHIALKAMPFCRAEIEPLMISRGHPLSFPEEGVDDYIDTSTPWGAGPGLRQRDMGLPRR